MIKSYKGWYTLINPEKFIKPIDTYMQSFRLNEDKIQLNYKSSLELKVFRYADFNKSIKKFSIEPFAIKYLKPTDGKYHRYYIDVFLELVTGEKILVEIKPKSETIPPKKPKKDTVKSRISYQKARQTYAINKAKWDAAKLFAKENNMIFTILTDEDLK